MYVVVVVVTTTSGHWSPLTPVVVGKTGFEVVVVQGSQVLTVEVFEDASIG